MSDHPHDPAPDPQAQCDVLAEQFAALDASIDRVLAESAAKSARIESLEQALRDVRQLLARFDREGGHGIPEHQMMRDRIAMIDAALGASHV